MRLQPFESSRQRSFKYNSFYNQFDSRNSLMPVEGSTKEAWHAISPNLPFSTVNPSGSYTTHAMVLVADGLKRKKGNLISSPNPRTRTRYPGIWIAWNVDRTHLVHREEHFFFFIIIIFFFSFFLFLFFFISLYLNDSRRLAQGTFKMKRFDADVFRRMRRRTLYVLCEWVCTCIIIILSGDARSPCPAF